MEQRQQQEILQQEQQQQQQQQQQQLEAVAQTNSIQTPQHDVNPQQQTDKT